MWNQYWCTTYILRNSGKLHLSEMIYQNYLDIRVNLISPMNWKLRGLHDEKLRPATSYNTSLEQQCKYLICINVRNGAFTESAKSYTKYNARLDLNLISKFLLYQ
jgi:hypothetical protein